MDMALQFTPPAPRLLQESYILPSPSPSPSPDDSPKFPSQNSPPPPPASPIGAPASPIGGSEPPPSYILPPPSPSPDDSPTFPSQISPPPPPTPGKPPVGLIAGLSVAGAGIVVAAIFIFWCHWRRKRRMRETSDLKSPERFDGEFPILQISPEDGPSASGGSPHKLQNNRPPDDVKVAMNPIPSHPAGFISSYPPPLVRNGSGSEKPPPPPQSPGIALGLSQSAFTYEDLAQATDNFSPANLLGEGGFGYVHKGVLPNGKTVAIKQLKDKSGQGDREFQAEVEVIGRIHHRNLVSLVGYCISGARRMLVYEFVPNNTIEFHLHRAERPAMNWPTRMKIALGSAKGLAYLHEDCQPKIIHRDIKATNILLDHAFEAKVADFGLAKFFFDTDTHVSTRIMGSFGYLAPEYASSGKLSEKSDVFSFGVVLLELITGRRPINKIHSFADDSLVEWARPLLMQALDEGNFNGLVDPKLENDYNHSEVTRMIACAAACVRHSARLRPRMSQILRALEGVIPLQDLNEGIKPGLGSQEHNANQCSEKLKIIFRKLARESQEQGNSEYSGTSTDSIGQLHSLTSTNTESRQTTEEIEPEK